MAYETLASFYDALMDQEQQTVRARRYLVMLKENNIHPGERVLDLACGTGALSVPLAKAGYRVIASDLSQPMLTQARQSYHGSGIIWMQQDLREFSASGAGAICVACDGLNYLASADELKQFFLRAYKALRPGGILLFDLTTPSRLDAMAGQVYALDQDDVAYLWFNHKEEETLVMELTFFLKQKNGLFLRQEEEHRQRSYSREFIVGGLKSAGFGEAFFWNGSTEEPAGEDSIRWQILAKKA